MNKKYLILLWVIPLCLVIGIIVGIFLLSFSDNQLMGKYDLYNCVYNNAQMNNFPDNPILIQKIQNGCICFRRNNYTDLINANCSDMQDWNAFIR